MSYKELQELEALRREIAQEQAAASQKKLERQQKQRLAATEKQSEYEAELGDILPTLMLTHRVRASQ